VIPGPAFRVAKTHRHFFIRFAGVLAEKGSDIHNLMAEQRKVFLRTMKIRKENDNDPEEDPQHYFDVIF